MEALHCHLCHFLKALNTKDGFNATKGSQNQRTRKPTRHKFHKNSYFLSFNANMLFLNENIHMVFSISISIGLFAPIVYLVYFVKVTCFLGKDSSPSFTNHYTLWDAVYRNTHIQIYKVSVLYTQIKNNISDYRTDFILAIVLTLLVWFISEQHHLILRRCIYLQVCRFFLYVHIKVNKDTPETTFLYVGQSKRIFRTKRPQLTVT